MPTATADPFAENRLPVIEILTAIDELSQDEERYPGLKNLTREEWFEIENCLNKPVTARRLQRYRPAVIIPSDMRFELTFYRPKIEELSGLVELDEDGDAVMESYKRKYVVRRMDAGDVMDLASVGPQMIEIFFGGNIDQAALMPVEHLAQHILANSVGERFKMCMHELSLWVLIKLCDLIIDKKTKEPLTYEEFMRISPDEWQNAISKVLSVNTVFFSTLTQHLPANLKEALRSLTGMLSLLGNVFVENIITTGLTNGR